MHRLCWCMLIFESILLKFDSSLFSSLIYQVISSTQDIFIFHTLLIFIVIFDERAE